MTAVSTIQAAGRAARAIGSLRKESVMPGFGLTLGLTLLYLGLIVLMPLAALIMKSAGMGPEGFMAAAFTPRALAAYRLSFGTALIAAAIDAVIGLIIAWVLVRYSFPGKRLVDAVVDLPFALPTAVAGIALASLYAKSGWIGAPLAELGLEVAFTPAGIVVALLFIGLPFVVRTVEPVLQDFDVEVEEASASLGSGRLQTFLRIILPAIMPAILTGFSLAFARGLGEYGSVIFIAGNLPMVSEIAPLLIIIELEQYDYAGATAIATVVLVAGFCMLFVINWLQRWNKRRSG
ncbi:MAG: sulfate ABC transporter permease subunit CysT [Hyphomicrobiales bacterium]